MPKYAFTDNPFGRPSHIVFFRLANLAMPPQPEDQVVIMVKDLKESYKKQSFFVAGLSLLAVMVIIFLLFSVWDGFYYSPAFLLIDALYWAYSHGPFHVVALLACCMVFTRLVPGKTLPGSAAASVHTPGRINRAALAEEQWFREGAENWTKRQRLQSSAAFAFAHLGMYIYPFAMLVPHFLGGVLLMRIYLRDYERTKDRTHAVITSTIAHSIYNKVAFAYFGLILVFYTIPRLIMLLF